MLVLTPPFAPVAIQALRVFRLLRLLRVARGFQLMSKLLTLEGLKYVMAIAVFLVVGGGTVFAGVESSVGPHVSTWDGIWWAVGTATTEGSNIPVTTNAGRAIAITLMQRGALPMTKPTLRVRKRPVTTQPASSRHNPCTDSRSAHYAA
jgi:hypothetical protein